MSEAGNMEMGVEASHREGRVRKADSVGDSHWEQRHELTYSAGASWRAWRMQQFSASHSALRAFLSVRLLFSSPPNRKAQYSRCFVAHINRR